MARRLDDVQFACGFTEKDAIRVVSRNNKRNRVFVFKCRVCGENEIGILLQHRLKHKGSCVKCRPKVTYSRPNKLRPHESRYNLLNKQATRRKGLGAVSLTYDEYLTFVGKNCEYCEASLDWAKHTGRGIKLPSYLDRKDNNKLYTKDNCVTCCSTCNRIKGFYLTHEEMKAAMKAVLETRNKHLDTQPERSYSQSMPSYRYNCEEHGEFGVRFSSFALAKEHIDETQCQQCGHVSKRVLEVPTLHFLGSGWTTPVPSGRTQTISPDPTKVAAEVIQEFGSKEITRAVKGSKPSA